MTEVKRLAQAVRDFQEELRRLDLMEKDAQKLIEEAGDQPIESPAAQEKISRGRIMIDLVAQGRRKLRG